MLYKLIPNKDTAVFESIEPLKFKDLPLEKHLEELIAKNLSGVLYEDNEIMPLFQERPYQGVADIYALNEQGDLLIYELKRGQAGGDAVYQALRYCETAAHWDLNKLQEKSNLTAYGKEEGVTLQEAHRRHFALDEALTPPQFNIRQHLVIVGSAGSDDLIRNVDYWKSRGLSVNFIPYRVYKIGEEYFFEFYSHPYDRHANPAHAKGVIFDTCATHTSDSIWYMCENKRVAAFDDQMHIVHWLAKGDIVFLYHRWNGIVAAGRVISEVKADAKDDKTLYRDLEWLTTPPTRESVLKAMPARQIKKVLDRNFYWAVTIKKPYLSREEVELLLEAVKLELA